MNPHRQVRQLAFFYRYHGEKTKAIADKLLVLNKGCLILMAKILIPQNANPREQTHAP
ncbi:hypothetical protein HRM2_31610 [Desulforapulum autotrophicum HRM2]|uniref:Uncharacterized protein n=1 Tax=Desulforapulum autotrophicum (strain ATCC 43914 / DSM 3382 / VKM B-1955 / HRM2) TaxID=177437 RepID=C0QL02_DESAH|nr:hypothetical protein HRM2_31610 [Desulforapulum autotrophicum HRM2]